MSARRSSILLRVLGVLVAVLAIGAAIMVNVSHRRALKKESEQRASGGKTRLVTAIASSGTPLRELALPAEAKPILQATIFAKTSGYMREIRVDKGARVKKDQILATILSPEIDAEVTAAKTTVNLKDQLAKRARLLESEGLESRQDRELADADLVTAQIALERALALQSYEVLRAPFDGVVTARYADPGALIPAATGSTSGGLPVVDVSVIDTLRVTLFVGQDAAPFVHAGDPAHIVSDERPEMAFDAKVTRVADALDPRTRTEIVEIELENHDRKLVPNSFVHATLKLKVAPYPLVPSEALLVRAGKTQVATVVDGKLHFVDVAVGSSTGKTVQLMSGVKAGDRVAVNVPSELEEGSVVDVAATSPSPSASTSAKPIGGGPASSNAGAP